MEAAIDATNPLRGQALLLEHCAVLDRLGEARLSARDRLHDVIGGDLTRLLLRALAGDHRTRSREL